MSDKVDDLVIAWIKDRYYDGIWHEEQYGCVVSIENPRFGIAHGGYCNTCAYTYEAVFFVANCTCPDDSPNKLNNKKDEIDIEGYSVADVLKQLIDGGRISVN